MDLTHIGKTREGQRLDENRRRTAHWNRWGPYLSERAWGTVREDYSPSGTAWDYFPHDHARSRAYRWNEDGLADVCDRHQYICFAIALWNGRDPILKERLFGLTNSEGNHGEDVASKFWEHFLYIAHAMHQRGEGRISLWDGEDGFFYDVVRLPGGEQPPIKIRSMVGLIPLFAVITSTDEVLDKFPGFKRRMEWFIANRPELTANITSMADRGQRARCLLSLVTPEQLRRVLRVLLNEREFLSPYGIRSVSQRYREQPDSVQRGGLEYTLRYEPGEAPSALFGGNSNWRGPVWLPLNYLLVEALQRFDYYVGESYTVECPTGSGQMKALDEVAVELSRRVSSLFLRDRNRRRPLHGEQKTFQSDPYWKDLLLFYEYFHGDDGRGCGASHQTGWTGLVPKLLQQSGARFTASAALLPQERTVNSAGAQDRACDP
jgi:hypothetical protein